MAIINIPTTFDEIMALSGENVTDESVIDALIRSKINRGKVDLDYMETLTGKSKDEILEVLTECDAVYQNPQCWDRDKYTNWETADEYLSGNLYAKLECAQKARDYHAAHEMISGSFSVGDKVRHRTYGVGVISGFNVYGDQIDVVFEGVGLRRFSYPGAFYDRYLRPESENVNPFDRNVKAIKAVMPASIKAEDIYAHIGSPWIEPYIIDDFMDKYFGKVYRGSVRPESIRTVYDSLSGTRKIPYKTRLYGKRDVNTTEKYGTKRMNALQITEKLLNNEDIAIYDYDAAHKPHLNSEETVAANDKACKIREAFNEFIHSTPQIEYEIEQMFYSKFGTIRQRKFNGSILEFPGLNPDITLYEHQRNSALRCILMPNTLLAEEVGAGKTYIMITAAMELRRMGISQKNLFVVPNAILGQWVDYFRLLYKDSKVLSIGPESFGPSKKNATLAKARDGDYDAVIMAYSCFDRFNLSRNTLLEDAEEQLKEVKAAIARNRSQSIPALNRMKNALQKKIDTLIKERNDPDTIYFDDLGVNTLFVDELHNYKNITLLTSSARFTRGAFKKGSAKNDAMLDKIHYVQRSNAGRGVIAATGTPVTNSITDLYTVQLMLQSGELTMAGVQTFDSWIGTFAKRESCLELDVDVSKLRMVTRYSFHNVPELSALFSSVAEFYSAGNDDLPEFEDYEEIVVPSTSAMEEFKKKVSERVDKIRSGEVKKTEDNLLKVTISCMLGCLDLRTVEPEAAFTRTCKIYYCARNVAEIYRETEQDRLTQLVFCDHSTPKAGFNAYDELKRILTGEFDIPADEIAFIHDATSDTARSRLFKKIREGRVRVVIGSTAKAGTGTNLQDKLYAVHHLDIPWTPAEMTQREGRILRQGNTNEKVRIFRYVTEGSFDAYSYQILERKQRFISEILQGCVSERDGRDIDMIFSYAEIKSICSGNADFKKRFEAANELSRYRILRKKAAESRANIRAEKERLDAEIPQWSKEVYMLGRDCEYASRQTFTDEKALRDKINRIIAAGIVPGEYGSEKVVYYRYHGFDIIRPASVSKEDPHLLIRREGTYRVSLKVSQDGTGSIDPAARINNAIRSLPARLSNAEDTLSRLKTRRAECIEEGRKDQTYEEQIRHFEELVEYYNKKLNIQEGDI